MSSVLAVLIFLIELAIKSQVCGGGLIANLRLTLGTPWTVARQATLSVGFFSGKNTGVTCHCFLQGVFLTQGSNLGLVHWQADSLPTESLCL